MLVKLTDVCGDAVLINPEHIIYVLQPGNDRSVRTIRLDGNASGIGAFPIKETMDEILNAVNNALNHGEEE